MAQRIGLMVATLIRARGETVGAVAELMGMHRNRLADKLSGRRAFSEDEIVKLAEHFGVAPGRLFEDPLEVLTGDRVRQTDPGLVRSTKGQTRRSGRVRASCTSHVRTTSAVDYVCPHRQTPSLAPRPAQSMTSRG